MLKKTLLILYTLFALSVLLVSARPQRFTKGDSGSTGEAIGTNTGVNTNSRVTLAETGSEAESEGTASAAGDEKSEATLEAFAQVGNLEGTAGGGVSAVGQETSAESQSKVRVFGKGRGSRIRARNRGRARNIGGGRKAAIDAETGGGFTGLTDVFGAAGGQATGDETEVIGESEVDNILGGPSRAKSRVKGISKNQGTDQPGLLELEAFAGAGGTAEAEGDVLAIGNVEATGETQAETVVNEKGESVSGVESVAGSRGYQGRFGSRAGAATQNGNIKTSSAGEGRAAGANTKTFGRARIVQTNYGSAGSAEGQSSSSSNRGEGSFAESKASIEVGGT